MKKPFYMKIIGSVSLFALVTSCTTSDHLANYPLLDQNEFSMSNRSVGPNGLSSTAVRSGLKALKGSHFQSQSTKPSHL